jgi:hypothetical protein
MVIYSCPEGETPKLPGRRVTMEFYSMEQFEIMADAMEELADWLAFEADMASGDPWAD